MVKFLLLFFTFLSFNLVSQNLALFSSDGVDLSNDTLVIIDSPDSTLSAHIHVKNNSASTMRVKIKKYELETVAGSYNYFCWNNQCYTPDVLVSTVFLQMQSGTITSGVNDLVIDYVAEGNAGTSKILYTAFSASNVNDSVSVLVIYKAENSISRNLFFKDLNNTDISFDTISVVCNPDSLFTQNIHIANNSNSAINIKVKKTVIQTIDSAQYYFKLNDSTYSDSILVSLDSLTLQSNYITNNDSDLIAYFNPNSSIGISKILYTAFNSENINDSVNVLMVYKSEYPNPYNLTFLKSDGTIINFDTINISGYSDSTFSYQIHVLNNTTNAIDVKVKKTELQVVDGTYNYFSWNSLTYEPTIYTSTNSFTLPSGYYTDGSKNLIAHYMSEGNSGTTTVLYTAYNVANVNDSVSVILNFETSLNTVDLNSDNYTFNSYPNPCSNTLNIDFEKNYYKDITIDFFDLTGKKLKTYNFNYSLNNVSIDVSNLNIGTYMYKIYNNNIIPDFGKFVISR